MAVKKPSKTELLKKTPNFIQIQFDYGKTFIFPYAEGVKIIEAFEQAEWVDSADYNNTTITSIPVGSSPEITVMPQETYLAKKMSALLDIPIVENPSSF